MAVDSGRVPLPGYGHARTCTSKGVIEKVERHAYADVAERWKKLRPDSLSWLVIIPKIEEREKRGKGQKKRRKKNWELRARIVLFSISERCYPLVLLV